MNVEQQFKYVCGKISRQDILDIVLKYIDDLEELTNKIMLLFIDARKGYKSQYYDGDIV